MTKKIVVDCCANCPLRELKNINDGKVNEHYTGKNWKHICTHPATDGMVLITTSVIHPDCPLENN